MPKESGLIFMYAEATGLLMWWRCRWLTPANCQKEAGIIRVLRTCSYKGIHYKKLSPVYTIFICLFDLYGQGRHIYTFKHTCQEDKQILMDDGASTIFLNAEGTMDDISVELKLFLDYVAGKKAEDPYIDKLDEAVKKAKLNRKWRREYMTLYMRDLENIEQGIEQGIDRKK